MSHIWKAAEKVESLASEKDSTSISQHIESQAVEKPKSSTTTKHKLDLILLMIAAMATAWLLFHWDVWRFFLLPGAGNKRKLGFTFVNTLYISAYVACEDIIICEPPQSTQTAFCLLWGQI